MISKPTLYGSNNPLGIGIHQVTQITQASILIFKMAANKVVFRHIYLHIGYIYSVSCTPNLLQNLKMWYHFVQGIPIIDIVHVTKKYVGLHWAFPPFFNGRHSKSIFSHFSLNNSWKLNNDVQIHILRVKQSIRNSCISSNSNKQADILIFKMAANKICFSSYHFHIWQIQGPPHTPELPQNLKQWYHYVQGTHIIDNLHVTNPAFLLITC